MLHIKPPDMQLLLLLVLDPPHALAHAHKAAMSTASKRLIALAGA
jgi:hypothetical protein